MFNRLLILAASALPLHCMAGNQACADEPGLGKLSCWALKGTVLVVGGAVVATQELASAVSSTTEVQVQLPSGEVLTGFATRKLLSGRTLAPGSPLALRCVVNPTPYAGDMGYAQCELKFPQKTPHPLSRDYRDRTGEQPSWSFGANVHGHTEPALLKLSRPLIWRAGAGL